MSVPAAIAQVSHTQVITSGMTTRATEPRGCASAWGPCRIATRNESSAEAYSGPNVVTASALRGRRSGPRAAATTSATRSQAAPPYTAGSQSAVSFAQYVASGNAAAAANPTHPSGSTPCFRAKAYTSPVPSTPSTASAAASTQPPSHSAATAPAMAGTATAMRTSRLRDMSGGGAAEPPLPPLVIEDGLEQVAPRDVGPEDRRDVQLGVGELPQQEIGEPAFTGRPDQQVRVAPGRRVELGADGVLVDVLESLDALEHLFGEEARRPGQLAARGVGDAQIERQPRAVPCLPLDALHRRPRAGREPGAVAQHVDRHPLVLQLGYFPRDVLLEQPHQRGDLGRGTLPVLLREGEQREHLHPGLERAFDRLAHRLHPRPVAQRPGQAALARPATVAVHDDGHVARRGPVQADLRQQVVRHLRPP